MRKRNPGRRSPQISPCSSPTFSSLSSEGAGPTFVPEATVVPADLAPTSDGESSINSPQAGSAEGAQFSSPPPVSSLSNGAAEENISDCDAGHQADLVATGRVSLDSSRNSDQAASDSDSDTSDNRPKTTVSSLSSEGAEEAISEGGAGHQADLVATGGVLSDQSSINSPQAGSAEGAQFSSPPPVSSLSNGAAEENISDCDAGNQVNPVAPDAQLLDASYDKSPINSPKAGSASDSKGFREEPTKPMLFSALEYLARPFLGALNILWEITGFLIKLFSLGTVDLSAQKERPVDSTNFKNHGNSAKSVKDNSRTSPGHTPTVGLGR
jgi:hypothetical protein